MSISTTVLITGASSGIGRATALRLVRSGRIVYAGVRSAPAADDLAAAGCRPVTLDVTDDATMRDALARIERDGEAVGALINNAGYSQSGAVEAVPLDAIRRQFETNVFGLVRLTQLVLPSMRRARGGRIVNVSSMGGALVFPGGGFYHATKYAVEAISDALRFETAGFGIRTIVIEPGLIRSNFAHVAAASIDGVAPEVADTYRAFHAAVAKTTAEAYERGPLARLGGEPDDVAVTIERALNARSPRSRYRVTPSATVLMSLRKALPDVAWDAFLASSFPRPV